MLVTDTVTFEMMERQNMTRGENVGVPVEPENPGRGLKWVSVFDLTDEDCDKIDRYYELKKTA